MAIPSTLAVLVLISAAGSEPAKPESKPKSKLPISKETTFITEPLTEDGYVDYASALNERLRGDTTSETNVVAGLVQATGPNPSRLELPNEFFEALGIPRPPEKGEYLIDFNDFFADEMDSEKLYQRTQSLKVKPWKANEAPRFAKWLKANDKPLSVVVNALQRPDYFHPLVSRKPYKAKPKWIIDSVFDLPNEYRAMASYLSMRAMLRCGEGEYDEAWADIMTIHRLGRMSARGGTIVELYIGISIGDHAHTLEQTYIATARPDAKQALKCQADLLALPPYPNFVDKLDLYERFDTLSLLQHIYYKGINDLPFSLDEDSELSKEEAEAIVADLDWNRMFRVCNVWYDKIVEAGEKPTRAERIRTLAELTIDFERLGKKVGVEKPEFFIIPTFDETMLRAKVNDHIPFVKLSVDIYVCEKIFNTFDRCIQTSRHGPLAFALAAYHADHGKYPAKLAELSPKYLNEVPDDLFSGKPLIYKPSEDGYLLYSVGVNGKDDGGKNEGLANRELDDLVLRSPSK